MKRCPTCERSYGDEAGVCEVDGAVLYEAGGSQDPLIGKTLRGRYRVTEKLGEGGMGIVYLAEQVAIGRTVALKLLHAEYATEVEYIKRFRHEARLSASLHHRNVITIHDFDQAEDRRLFIVMEYLSGRSLREIIKGGPLEIGRALQLGIQIAQGLSAAHRAGVIHRDVKPENIMVVGEDEEIKLMDFGISRLKDRGAMTQLTRSGVIMGSPAYMPPEQIERGQVSEKSDIYAFGITLYEMLSGSVPFRASTPSGVLMKHLREMPFPLRKSQQEIPPSVERVVMQALEKDPKKRQRSMEDIAQELKNAQNTLAIAHGETLVEALKPMSRNVIDKLRGAKWKLVGSSIVVAFLVLGGILWGVSKIKTERAARQLPIVSLTIHADKRELNVNESITLKVKGKYSDGYDGEITQGLEWQSSNPPVATVTSTGQVDARRAGHADITTHYRGVISSPLTILVKEVKNGRIEDHINVAKFYRDRGEYVDAFAELEKAKTLDPANKTVQTEFENTRKACLSDKKRGQAELRC